jgi:hypothetical protein
VEPAPAAVVEVLLGAVVDGDVAFGEDEPQAPSPITPHINAAAVTRLLLLLETHLVVSGSFIAFLLVANAGNASSRLTLILCGGGNQPDDAPMRSAGV